VSRSWGHTVQRLEGRARVMYAAGDRSELHTCGTCRCGSKHLATWLATYRYVTGRAGRVAWARRYLCDDHAERFRRRWQPEEESGPAPRHALEQIVAPGAGPPAG